MNRMLAVVQRALDDLMNPGEFKADSLTITSLPKNGNGLRVGSLFNDGGTVRIVQENEAYAPSFVATAAVGSVTVLTP